ncbi:class 3 adenylate cyclase/predicted ATPase [Kineosphaera limosa]|uniref:Guanylate cyclase domain-containing protein n=1 Tax=Kineosphaera limosa NBRC 100340 TaxID=1184609 RepID=K6VDA4_9MICO|nr:AAA family ATPase [Kineosphaera limosa]NYE02328.1 class 3 adenylate cyclase/predicted ATPase [Kineosphaera limosa]GAB94183.1 hypothetical protein KILIM_003_01060 [Kineosphaera limosa NBRC 100340]
MAVTFPASARESTHGSRGIPASVGAVLVADLVGFTPLTRHLSARGPRGVEALHDWLDETFHRWDEAVASEGGQVTAYAGDALTAVFTAPHARRRALAAAQQMQRTTGRLRPLGSLVAPALPPQPPPPTPLLRIGIATGHVSRTTLSWAISGDSVGPNALPGGGRVEASGDEPPAQVLSCEVLWGETVRAAMAAQQRATPGGIALAEANSAAMPMTANAPADQGAPADAASIRFLERPGGGGRVGRQRRVAEHRVVTTVFVRLGPTSDGVGPVRGLLPQAAAIVARCGGELRQVDGSGPRFQLVLGFGAPRARPDDAAAAVSCATLLLQAARDVGICGTAGVATGTAFCAELGSPAHREYVVVGESVNLAARMAAAAGRDDARPDDAPLDDGQAGGQTGQARAVVWMDEATAQRCGQALHPRSRGRRQFKGAGEVAVYATQIEPSDHDLASPEPAGPDAIPELNSGSAARFVGRARQLRLAATLSRRAARGHGAALLVIGDPGIGKSAFLDAVAEALPTPETIIVRTGQPLPGDIRPYLPWRPVWRELLFDGARPDPQTVAEAATAVDLPDLAPLLAAPLGLSGHTPPTRRWDPGDRARATTRVLLALLGAQPDSRPRVIVVDDAHRLDELSMRLLHDLMARAPALGLFLLVASPSETPFPHFSGQSGSSVIRIHLGSLALEERTRLARSWGHGALPAQQLTAAIERSGGNPLMLKHLLACADDPAPPWGADPSLPLDVHRLVLARVDGLLGRDQRVLRAAAVIGPQFTDDALQAALGGSAAGGHDLREELDRLSRIGLLQPDARQAGHRFVDTLVRDVVYAAASLADRAHLHEATARHLEATLPPTDGDAADRQTPDRDARVDLVDLLAHHYGRTANVAKQREWIGAAARAAERSYATSAALGYLAHLEAIEVGGQRAPLLVRRGALLAIIARWSEAEIALREAVRLAEQRPDREQADAAHTAADARRELGSLLVSTTRFEEAVTLLAQAARQLRAASDLAGASRALDRLAFAHFQHGDIAAAGRAAARQQRLAESLGDEALVAAALENVALTAAARGQHDAALRGLREAHRRAQQVGDPRLTVHLCNDLAGVYAQSGDLRAAQRWLRRAMRAAARMGYERATAYLTANLGEVRRATGDLDSASAHYVEALRTALAIGDWVTTTQCTTGLAICAAQQGRPGHRRLLRQARAVADSLHPAYVLDELAECEARLAVAAPADAQDCGDPMVDALFAQALAAGAASGASKGGIQASDR